jgi:hypothetical protein
VEYRDYSGSLIGTTWWPQKFDLALARGNGRSGSQAPKSPVFSVVTVLKTSIELDRNRPTHEEMSRLMDGGILNDPAVDVTVSHSRMTIISRSLKKMFQSFVQYYPAHHLRHGNIVLTEPFAFLAHHYSEIKQYEKGLSDDTHTAEPTASIELDGSAEANSPGQKRVPNPDIKAHLRMLLDFTDNFYQNSIDEELDRHKRGTCTFAMLWLLFKPGIDVYRQDHGSLAAYVVKNIEVDTSSLADDRESDGVQVHKLYIWNLDFDGRFVGRSPDIVQIHYFEGELEITSLNVFPCHYRDIADNGETRERLTSEGKRWFHLLCGGQVYYAGPLPASPHKDVSEIHSPYGFWFSHGLSPSS